MGFHGDLVTQLMEIESFKYENHVGRCFGENLEEMLVLIPRHIGWSWVVLRDFALNQCWGCSTWI